MGRQQNAVGAVLPNGFRVLANYMDQLVIAQNQHPEAPEPFVVWHLDRDSNTWGGSYFKTYASAELCFCKKKSIKQELHRQRFLALVEKYGIPKSVYIDNPVSFKIKVTRLGILIDDTWHDPIELLLHVGEEVTIQLSRSGQQVIGSNGQFICLI